MQNKKNIGVIGTGYVGLVTGLCFAHLGNHVVCMDTDKTKIDALSRGIPPFYEKGVGDLLTEALGNGLIRFTADMQDLVDNSEVIFISVGTPLGANGEYDLKYIKQVAGSLRDTIRDHRLIVVKSTVPVGCTEMVASIIAEKSAEGPDFDIAFCPEFLSEGQAVEGFMDPYRTVIGARSERAYKILEEMHEELDKPLIRTTIRESELIKLSSNVFLAVKISYVNELAKMCDLFGVDVKTITHGMGLDQRIGNKFLDAGAGYGGPCLKKDLRSVIAQAEAIGYEPQILSAVYDINESMPAYLVTKLKKHIPDLKGKNIGILGLSFKQGTSDMRDSQVIPLVGLLEAEGAHITAYDPQAREEALKVPQLGNIKIVDDEYQAAQADALVIMTGWQRFADLDLGRISRSLSSKVLVDGRNILSRQNAENSGLIYEGVGH